MFATPEESAGQKMSIFEAPVDVQLVVAASLHPCDLLSLGCVSRAGVELSRMDSLWRWHLNALMAENTGTSVARRPGTAVYEQYQDFMLALIEKSALEDATVLDEFAALKSRTCKLAWLSKLGTISDAGTADARFDPFGDLPRQVPAAAALELLDLMQDVPKEKGVVVGRAAQKTAHILGVTESAVISLAKRVGSKRRLLLLKALKEPFPMEYVAKASVESVELEEDHEAIISEVLQADPKTLSPRKRAMRRELLTKNGEIAQLKAENAELERLADEERRRFSVMLTSSNREIRRLHNTVELLETEDKSALQSKIRHQKIMCEKQAQLHERAQKNAAAIASRLQQARDQQAIDAGIRHEEGVRAKKAMEAAQAQLAQARAEAAKERQRAALATEEMRRAREAEADARRVAQRKHYEWVKKQEEIAIEQSKAGKCDDHFQFIAGCVMATAAPGERLHFKQPNASRKGPGLDAVRAIKARKGFEDLAHAQRSARAKTLNDFMVTTAKGEEHVVALMTHHKKANPALYKQIGLKERTSLTTDQLVSIAVHMTGALGKAVHRALKEAGIDVVSNAAVQRALACSDHSHEICKITRPNPNPKTCKKHPLLHGGVLRVTDVGKVLQDTTDQHAMSDDLESPANIPSDELWIEFLADKGGGTDKLVAKFLNCRTPDSINHLVLLVLCDGIGDDYWAKRVALGPVYRQIDRLRSDRFTIHAPWKPRLPKHIHLNDDGVPEYAPVEVAKPKKGSVVSAQLSVNTTGMGVSYVFLHLKPRAVVSTTKSPGAPTVFGKGKSPRTADQARSKAVYVPKIARRRLEGSLLDDEETSTSTDPYRPRMARTQHRIPAKAQRMSHAITRIPSHSRAVVPRRERHVIRLVGCTFNADCTDPSCCAKPDAELKALRAQCAAAEEATLEGTSPFDRAERSVRFFHGGDMLSIMHPMGLQGPSSTEFCYCCHARLNQINGAGLPASRSRQVGFTDGRPELTRNPPRRLGTQAIRKSSRQLRAAKQLFAAGKGKKPQEAAFHSSVHDPLFNLSDIITEAGLVPLHVMLGQGLRIFNALESQAKLFDAQRAGFAETIPDDDAELAHKIRAAVQKIEKADADLAAAMADMSHHAHGIDLIKSTPDSEEAVRLGAKPPMPCEGVYTPLPLEEEYRAHHIGMAAAATKVNTSRKTLELEKKAAAELRATNPGLYEMKMLAQMKKISLKREAYHGGSFVGDDVHEVMDPEVWQQFCAILAAPSVATRLKVVGGHVKLSLLGIGALQLEKSPEKSTEYRVFRELGVSFSRAMSLFNRGTPLCESHIAEFRRRTDRFARAYATALPAEQSQPKTHILCAEMPDQAEMIGGTGVLGESGIEGEHVRDNHLKRQHASTKDVCENLRLRARGFDRMSDTRIANIRDAQQRAHARKRAKVNHASRKRKQREE